MSNRKIIIYFLVVIVLFIIAIPLTSCSPEVSTAELEQIIQRDGVPFDVQSIPDEVLDRLASHRVVVVGETHFLREHYDLMTELLRELHARRFRQILVVLTPIFSPVFKLVSKRVTW